LLDFGEYTKSLALYEDSEQVYAKHCDEGNPDLLWAHMILAGDRVLAGDPDRGRRELLRLLPGAARIEGPEGRLTSQLLRFLAVADEAQGHWRAARRHGARALAILDRKRGADHLESLSTRGQLARAEAALG